MWHKSDWHVNTNYERQSNPLNSFNHKPGISMFFLSPTLPFCRTSFPYFFWLPHEEKSNSIALQYVLLLWDIDVWRGGGRKEARTWNNIQTESDNSHIFPYILFFFSLPLFFLFLPYLEKFFISCFISPYSCLYHFLVWSWHCFF